MSRKRIYMDYASTTPLDAQVLKAMLPYFGEKFGNPSSIHAEGVEAKKALEAARKSVGLILNARATEIIFTGGGTESNNLAIFGMVRAIEKTGIPISKMHFVTPVIEHSSVLECFRELESRGAKVSYAPVRENGLVDPKTITELLRPETVLVSVGYANNEIGTIQPVAKIGKLIKDFRNRLKPQITNHKSQTNSKSQFSKFQTPIFHSDASQAPLYLDCSVERLGVDLLTLDGHKMYGPKGVGVLYVRRSVTLAPILFGGGQERGLRSTTENLPLVVGFAKAFEIAAALREKEFARLAQLRDSFYSLIRPPAFRERAGANKRIDERIVWNGDMKERLPNNINISIPNIDTEFALLQLDAAGIACSTKSSCLGSEGGSYVVRALGGDEERARRTLRFTFGRDTTKKDITLLLKHLFRIIG